MATKHEISYILWASDIIPQFKFDTEDDANHFDEVLKKWETSEECKKEWDDAERQYASLYAVQYAIQGGDFHFNLDGEESDELLEAIETFCEIDEYEDGDEYRCVMNYLFQKYHPQGVEKEPFSLHTIQKLAN